jgi:hypothetical protein
MGGGSSSSQESAQTTQNYDQDTTVSGGGIGVGADGIFYQKTTEVTGDMATGAAAIAGDGNSLENVSGIKVGDNSSLIMRAMDDATENVLISAFNVVGTNASNMMSLAAGRDPNAALADESGVIAAEAAANPLNVFLKGTGGKIAATALVGSLLFFVVKNWRKHK